MPKMSKSFIFNGIRIGTKVAFRLHPDCAAATGWNSQICSTGENYNEELYFDAVC
jgi:hypothetical protein